MLDTLLHPHHLPEDFISRRVDGSYLMEPGETKVMMDFQGAGCIRRFFHTQSPQDLREMIFRMWWDGEAEPSVECPVSDFFGIGHDLNTSELNSPLFYVAPNHGFNCYVPMPFGESVKITLTNESKSQKGLHYVIDFHEYEEPLTVPWRFHTAWRRVYPAYRRGAGITVLEAKGEGRLLGCIYHVIKRDSDDRLSHGGAEQFFIDGDSPKPQYIYGTGGENYAHHAWGFSPRMGPYAGVHHVHPLPGIKRGEGVYAFEPHAFEQHDGGHYSMYRFHIPDPIRFKKSIRFMFGTCENEISSTVYWYQSEPHHTFSLLPPKEERHFSQRITEESTLRPLDFGVQIPVAVLGPMLHGEVNGIAQPWSPAQPTELGTTYANNLIRPYADTVRPPHEVRWRRSQVRAGFLDLAAIHRPKVAVRARGLWNYRSLPPGTTSYHLFRVRSSEPQEVVLRLGFEDEVSLWQNGSLVTELSHLEPLPWTTEDVKLTLQPGVNEFVLGCTQRRMGLWSAWSIYSTFLTPGGDILEGLDFETFDDLDVTPERWREPWPPDGIVESDNYRDPLAIT